MQKSFSWDCNSEGNVCLLLQEMIWVSVLMSRDWALYSLLRRELSFFLSLFLPLPRWKALHCFFGPTQNDGRIAIFYKWTETEHCTRKTSVWLFLGAVCRMLKYHIEISYAKSVSHNLEIINIFLAKTSNPGEAKSEMRFLIMLIIVFPFCRLIFRELPVLCVLLTLCSLMHN